MAELLGQKEIASLGHATIPNPATAFSLSAPASLMFQTSEHFIPKYFRKHLLRGRTFFPSLPEYDTTPKQINSDCFIMLFKFSCLFKNVLEVFFFLVVVFLTVGSNQGSFIAFVMSPLSLSEHPAHQLL